jgi:hypothetical protein
MLQGSALKQQPFMNGMRGHFQNMTFKIKKSENWLYSESIAKKKLL